MATAQDHTTEERRLAEQTWLDSLKSAAERNKWGQFATPFELALSLTRYAQHILGEVPIRFLDPAIGTGAFFSALSQAVSGQAIDAAVGVELDPLFAETAEKLWGNSSLQIIRGDFTKQEPPEQRFNLVLTNPPYVRHHHLSIREKERLKNKIAHSLLLKTSGLAGLYCYFLLLCHDWMEENGLAIWLIPSEFMDVNYGAIIRRYLTEHVTLLHIHRFCPTEVQFPDALVSSAVVVFRKVSPPAGHHALFSFSGKIERPRQKTLVPIDTLRASQKWTRFPEQTKVETKCELTLSDLFFIKRGIATGSNRFFILNAEQIETWEIPKQFLRPILPGPRHISANIIDAHPNGDPVITPRIYLLDCSVSEETIKTLWPRFHEYIQRGHEEEITRSYIVSHRAPWYSQELRPPAPFLCTYMGRVRNGKHPFRFIWNRSQATAHNVYLMLYPKGPLLTALNNHPEMEKLIFNALQLITPSHIQSEGRVYGGGLHKVEPKELGRIPACKILDTLEGYVGIEKQGSLFLTS